MQVLISAAAHARVSGRLAADFPDLDILTIGEGGAVSRGSEILPEEAVDPEVVWVSLEMYPAGLLPQTFRLLLKAPSVKWTQVFSAGIDNPAFRMVMEKGVRLSKSSAQAPAIAEYVIAHAFALLHPIAEQRAAQAAHDWRSVRFREIGATRWLLVGFGPIGQEIALRLQPFGAHLTVVRRSPEPHPHAAAVKSSRDLAALLPESDVVVLACPLNDDTRGLADAAFFTAMKPGAILVNIARGGVVDEAALKAGLDRDQPGHAVLDVFQTEPLPADAWFWDHPKVTLTPHASNLGDGVMARGDALFLENLRRYRAGEPLLNEAHPSEVGL